MSARKLAGIARLSEEGFHEEAGLVGLRMYRKANDRLKGRIEKAMASIEKRSQHAALVSMLGLVRSGDINEAKLVGLMRRACRGEDEDIVAEAQGVLGGLYLRHWADGPLAAAYLHESARGGNLDARYDLATAYARGLADFPVDVETAQTLYSVCIDDGHDARAMYDLAMMIQSGALESDEYDVRALLEEAEVAGHLLAATALDMLDREEGPDPDDYPDLPVAVVPEDPVRLRMARNEIVRVFEGTDERAENIVAAMHGFLDWDDLIDAARQRDEPPGPFDEDQSPEDQAAMREAQAEVAMMGLGVDMFTADAVVDLLRITSRGALPSLLGLAERVEQSILAAGGKA